MNAPLPQLKQITVRPIDRNDPHALREMYVTRLAHLERVAAKLCRQVSLWHAKGELSADPHQSQAYRDALAVNSSGMDDPDWFQEKCEEFRQLGDGNY